MPKKRRIFVSTPERAIENQILNYLRLLPHCMAFKINQKGYFDTKQGMFRRHTNGSIKGVSDILGIYRGCALAIECKSAKGKLSPDQESFLATWQEQGGLALTAKSLEEVVVFLRKVDSELEFE